MIEVVERTNTVEISIEKYEALVRHEAMIDVVARYVKEHEYIDRDMVKTILGIGKVLEYEPI